MIAAIACVDLNYGIGYQNKLLISIPEDLKRFKGLTLGEVVIMGRKTWESLPKKPLPNRINWVITNKPEYYKFIYTDDNVYFLTMEEVKRKLEEIRNPPEDVEYLQNFWIIGGESIYRELLSYCDRIELTLVSHCFGNVDAYFPTIHDSEWYKTVIPTKEPMYYDDYQYRFITYGRKQKNKNNNHSDNPMIVLVGESASGKSSIERNLVDNYGYKKIVTYTTREPRPNEVDGVDYHYIAVDKFNELKEQGFFAETAQYNGWNYGTAKEDCTNDKVAVLTPHGLRQISKLPDIKVVSFYINVPRRDRLIKILQRGDNIEEAYRRSLSDVGQFDGIADEVNYVINNDGYKKNIEEMTKEILEHI